MPSQTDSSTSPLERKLFRQANLLMLVIGLAWLVAEFGSLQDGSSPPHKYGWATLVFQPLICSGMLGIFLFYLFLPRVRWEFVATTAFGLGLEFWLASFRAEYQAAFEPAWLYRGLCFGTGMGVAAVGALLFRAAASRGDRALALGYLTIASLSPLFEVVGGWYTARNIASHPLVYDLVGWALDGSLGFQPAYLSAAFTHGNVALRATVLLVYVQLAVFMAVAVLAQIKRPSRVYFNAMAVLFLLGAVGPLLYNLFPMMGVSYIFRGYFPQLPPPPIPVDVGPVLSKLPKYRNCLPSLHMAWILVFFWATRHLGRGWQPVGGAIVVLTMLGALDTGHFLLDFVPSFPLVLACCALFTPKTKRNRHLREQSLWFGLGGLALFYAAILMAPRVMASHGWLFWGGSLALVVGAIWLEGRLAAVSLSEEPLAESATDVRDVPGGDR